MVGLSLSYALQITQLTNMTVGHLFCGTHHSVCRKTCSMQWARPRARGLFTPSTCLLQRPVVLLVTCHLSSVHPRCGWRASQKTRSTRWSAFTSTRWRLKNRPRRSRAPAPTTGPPRARWVTEALHHGSRWFNPQANKLVILTHSFECMALPWGRMHDPPCPTLSWEVNSHVGLSCSSPFAQVHFDSVQMRYRQGLPLVLKGLTVHVPAASKCGVVGRTGAAVQRCGSKFNVDPFFARMKSALAAQTETLSQTPRGKGAQCSASGLV